MRGNLLVLGCSYSELGHHREYGKVENSYTIHLKNEFNFTNLINLAIPGASPSTVNRILLQYLDNPAYGMPDFVFIQWPNASRHEYYTDEHSSVEDTAYRTDDGLVYLDWHNESFGPQKASFANSTWTSTSYIKPNLQNAHKRLTSNKSQQLIQLCKEVGIAEQYLGNLKIPYAYVESDYWNEEDNGLLSTEHQTLEAYRYAQHLCHKQFFIPKVGIQRDSPTFANDNYKDGHPGAISHRQFADAIIPKLKELIP